MNSPKNAYVLRQSPSGNAVLESIGLKEGVIVNGWSDVKGLIELNDYAGFRNAMRQSRYYINETDNRKAGYAAATMWRFLKDMAIGDFVVVPYTGSRFYVAEITGAPTYCDNDEARKKDSCYRRRVKWLNDGQPISRKLATSKLVSRMKIYQTSAEATDLIPAICQALELAKNGPASPETLFHQHLRTSMIKATLEQILNGYMQENKFEQLVAAVLRAQGIQQVKVTPRIHDKGADITGIASLGNVLDLKIGVQVKYHTNETDVYAIDQLVNSIEVLGLDAGWVVSSAKFSAKAQQYAEKLRQEKQLRLALVDGEEFAGMIVDAGLSGVF